jgi:hypothetical protein
LIAENNVVVISVQEKIGAGYCEIAPMPEALRSFLYVWIWMNNHDNNSSRAH